jgi:hypothetical protein
MLTKEEFDEWARNLNLSVLTKAQIERIRSAPPARRVQSRIGNVTGVFNQSTKMPHSIQWESRTVELPAILMMEFDDDVLEIWDQPPSFTISYKRADGSRMTGHLYTADFFVLRKNWAGWEEWKPEETLARLAEKNPNRYFLGSDGRWRCPPCEEYAESVGLSFQVHSSAQINWILLRNYNYLKSLRG